MTDETDVGWKKRRDAHVEKMAREGRHFSVSRLSRRGYKELLSVGRTGKEAREFLMSLGKTCDKSRQDGRLSTHSAWVRDDRTGRKPMKLPNLRESSDPEGWVGDEP